MSKSKITATEAKHISQKYIDYLKLDPEPLFKPWLKSSLGKPLLVYSDALEPLNWMIPVMIKERVIGNVMVGIDGSLMGHTYYYKKIDELSKCPKQVTWISSEDAVSAAENILKKYRDAQFSKPVYVFDTKRSKHAWMIEVLVKKTVTSRIFIEMGNVYERKKDEKPKPPGIRG